jgi:hypothetical protein
MNNFPPPSPLLNYTFCISQKYTVKYLDKKKMKCDCLNFKVLQDEIAEKFYIEKKHLIIDLCLIEYVRKVKKSS